MKLLIASTLLACLAAHPAYAREGKLPATQLGPKFMSVLDIDTAKSQGGQVISAWSIVFLARATEEMTPGQPVDWIGTHAEYDCATPGKWRATHMHLYALDRPGEPVDSDETVQPWTMAGPSTPPLAAWRGVCEGRFDASGISYLVEDKRSNILISYRALLRSRATQ